MFFHYGGVMAKFKFNLLASIVISNICMWNACCAETVSLELEAVGKDETAALGKLKTSALRTELASILSRDELVKNAAQIRSEIFLKADEFVTVSDNLQYVNEGGKVTARGTVSVDRDRISAVLGRNGINTAGPAVSDRTESVATVSPAETPETESAESQQGTGTQTAENPVPPEQKISSEPSVNPSEQKDPSAPEALIQAKVSSDPELNKKFQQKISVTLTKIEELEDFLKQGADPNATVTVSQVYSKKIKENRSAEVPLIYKYLTYSNVKTEVVKLLIKYGAYYNWESEDGRLSVAKQILSKGDDELIAYWLSLNPDLKRLRQLNQWSSRDDDDRESLLYLWLQDGKRIKTPQHLAVFNRLMELGLSPNELIGVQNLYLLYFAYSKGGIDYLNAAIDHGADPNLYTQFESGAFYLIAEENDPVSLKNYFAHGGKTATENDPSFLSTYFSIRYRNSYNLNRRTADAEQLRKADASLDFVKAMIEAGSDYNYETADGKSTIAEAMMRQPVEIVDYWAGLKPDLRKLKKYDTLKQELLVNWMNNKAVGEPKHLEITGKLIDLGCDPSARNGNHSIVETAYEKGGLPYVSLLFEKGADPDFKDAYGNPLLFWAAERRDPQLLKLFATAGADFNAADKYGKNVLFEYVNKKDTDPEFIRNLLDAGCDADFVRASKGTTVLMEAVSDYRDLNLPVVDVLLSRVKNINAVSKTGKTALILAVEEPKVPDEAVILKLIKAGADVNLADQDGATALTFAIVRGLEPVIRLLQENGADTEKALSVKTTVKVNGEKVEKTLKQMILETDNEKAAAIRQMLKDYL